jgi:iron complex outermembrane receptor protein
LKSLGSPRAAAVAAAAALLAALPATAQQEVPASEPTTDSSKVEEIIVRGSTQGIEDFASADSVTAFNAADLQALGAQSIEDIAAFTPNLEIVTSGATTPTFFIRGVGLSDFNANATSSVAIYQDDVNVNAQGLQLGTLFDIEAVNVLRGPQGTGLARNASAGAIKLYSRKPTGQFSGFLIGSAGNYDFRDYQGGVEAPLWRDMLSARVAFRWSERDGFVDNRCGGLAAEAVPGLIGSRYEGFPMAFCRTQLRAFPENQFTGRDIPVPAGLPTEANDLGNWATRGTVRFEPDLNSSWLGSAQFSKRDERSRLGQAYGTQGLQFGLVDVEGYKKPEVAIRQAGKFLGMASACNCDIANSPGISNPLERLAIDRTAPDLARNLDPEPYVGYYDRVGPTENEVINSFVRGEIYLPWGVEMQTVTGYASYDRLIDVDLDFSPTVLAEVVQNDEVYQLTEDVSFTGDLGEFDPATWGFGALFLYEDLDADQDISLRDETAGFLISGRNYSQQIRSYGVYGEFARDLWQDFTLDGGVRWNWENKEVRMKVLTGRNYGVERARRVPTYFRPDETWEAPTGTLRLTYRFQEDTRAYWKYTRGWKSGHFNATAPPRSGGITIAEPETIDAFESGFLGSWFRGGLEADLALFYYMYDNYQLFTIDTDFGTLPAFVVLNADNAEVYGAEIDLVTRPWAGAFLEVRGSWLESRFVDFVQQQITQRLIGSQVVTIIREVDATGNRLINSPQFKVSATIEQAIPLGRFGALIPRYDVVWTSETFFDTTEGRGVPGFDGSPLVPKHTFSQVAFWLHHARLSYAPPSQNPVISFWVRNIADKAYRQLGADATIFLGTTLHFVGDPRTYGVDIVFNF